MGQLKNNNDDTRQVCLVLDVTKDCKVTGAEITGENFKGKISSLLVAVGQEKHDACISFDYFGDNQNAETLVSSLGKILTTNSNLRDLLIKKISERGILRDLAIQALSPDIMRGMGRA